MKNVLSINLYTGSQYRQPPSSCRENKCLLRVQTN